jgi:hypothetical protein
MLKSILYFQIISNCLIDVSEEKLNLGFPEGDLTKIATDSSTKIGSRNSVPDKGPKALEKVRTSFTLKPLRSKILEVILF